MGEEVKPQRNLYKVCPIMGLRDTSLTPKNKAISQTCI